MGHETPAESFVAAIERAYDRGDGTPKYNQQQRADIVRDVRGMSREYLRSVYDELTTGKIYGALPKRSDVAAALERLPPPAAMRLVEKPAGLLAEAERVPWDKVRSVFPEKVRAVVEAAIGREEKVASTH